MTEAALLIGAGLVTATAIVVLYRVIKGPTVQDRIIAINIVGTSTVVVIALVAAGLDRPEFLDIALVYALLNFVLSIAAAKFTIDRGEVL